MQSNTEELLALVDALLTRGLLVKSASVHQGSVMFEVYRPAPPAPPERAMDPERKAGELTEEEMKALEDMEYAHAR